MPAYPPGFDPANAVPGIYIAVTFGSSPLSGGASPIKVIVYGSKITTNLTGAAPSFTTTAGTASNSVPVQVVSESDAIAKFGQGSELHRGCRAVFLQWPQATLYACPVAETGAAATIVCTATGAPTAAITVRVYVNGEPSVTAAIASGDSVTTVATAIATAILQTPDLPVTAQFLAGVVTLTAKNTGLRGNQHNVRVELTSGTQTVNTDGTTLARTLAGLTLTMSGGTASTALSAGIYRMSGGSGQDTLTAALAATLSTRYHREVAANIDATAIQALASQIDTKAGIDSQLREQGVVASVDTYANAVTMAQTNLNKARMQLAWSYNADAIPIEIAAQVCVARLVGDSIAGGGIVGEIQDSAANLNGCVLKSVRQQFNEGDRPTPTQQKNSLNNGVCVLVPAASNPGYLRIVSSITTRSLDAGSQPNYSVRKTKIVTEGDATADNVFADFGVRYAGFKLAPDATGNPPPTQPRVTTPKLVRGQLYRILKEREADGKLVNVDLNEPNITCVVDGTNPGRLLFSIPPNVIPDVDQIVGEERPF